MSRSEYLIVDTSAFIKNAQLQDIGQNVITIPEVVQEVTSKRQIRRLVVLPYDLQIKEADPDSIKFVTEFSKKTGDYPSLSSTDLKVIALTYELHKYHCGAESIKEPITRQISYINHSVLTDKEVLAGFYVPSKKSKHKSNDTSKESSKVDEGGNDEEVEDYVTGNEEEDSDEYYSADNDDNESDNENIAKETKHDFEINNETISSDGENRVECHSEDDVLVKIEDDSDSGHDQNDDDDDDDDDGEWITPSNLKRAQQKVDDKIFDDKPMIVSCLTTDFAMQNVLKQMGLNVVSLDGRLIRQLRTFILRCYACFKTTSIMTKQFCPKCGHKTLKRVAVSVDEEGKQQLHINLKRPLTARGKKYSLPTFKGGKHANNPIVCEDQPLPDQRPTRLGRTKTNALDPDYIAGMSPFAIHDINSKSAMLGIRTNRQNDFKYWMHKNPNVVRRKSKK